MAHDGLTTELSVRSIDAVGETVLELLRSLR